METEKVVCGKFKEGETVTSPAIPKEYEHKGIIGAIITRNNKDYIWVKFGLFMMLLVIDYNSDEPCNLFHYNYTETEKTNK